MKSFIRPPENIIDMKTCKHCGTENADFAPKASQCRACDKARYKRWQVKNAVRIAEDRRVRYAANKEKIIQESKSYYEKNKVRVAEYKKKYNEANKDAVAARNKEWQQKNAASGNAYKAERRAKKLQATPVWAISFFMEQAYDLAKRRTQCTGFVWEVDHVVPLKNNIVCGLHAHTNLQVIPKLENLKKGNRFWPDMPQGESLV